MMKALVLGGESGLLGQALAAALGKAQWDVSLAGRESGDFTNPEFVRELLNSANADAIFNTLAWTKVDDAELHEYEADQANRVIPLNLASNLAKMQKGHLVHYSTDFVFSGRDRSPRPEDAPTDPQSVYGRTKLAGEEAVLQHLPARSCIIRTAWLFGPGKKNFVATILEASKKKNILQVVDDQYGSPTYTPDLASWSVQLAEKKACGIWNGVNSGGASWCELAAEAVSLAHGACIIDPISSAQWPQKAMRPPYSMLSNAKLAGYLGINIRPWPQALRDYIFGHILECGEKALATR